MASAAPTRPVPQHKVLRAYGGRWLHEQSHGESFMALVLERLRGRGLYLLDEPEAALSPTRQMGLLAPSRIAAPPLILKALNTRTSTE